MTIDPVVLTGRPEAPVARRLLRAGPGTVGLDGADLRRIRVGGAELVQRGYGAVRDAPGNPIPAPFSDGWADENRDRSTVTFVARHAHEDIDFRWRGRIDGAPDGSVRYEMDGICHGAFAYSKIGFNVHHALAGAIGPRYRPLDEQGGARGGGGPGAIAPPRMVDGERARAVEA